MEGDDQSAVWDVAATAATLMNNLGSTVENVGVVGTDPDRRHPVHPVREVMSIGGPVVVVGVDGAVRSAR